VENVEGGLIVDTDILIDLLRKKDYAVLLIEKLEEEIYLATSAINATDAKNECADGDQPCGYVINW